MWPILSSNFTPFSPPFSCSPVCTFLLLLLSLQLPIPEEPWRDERIGQGYASIPLSPSLTFSSHISPRCVGACGGYCFLGVPQPPPPSPSPHSGQSPRSQRSAPLPERERERKVSFLSGKEVVPSPTILRTDVEISPQNYARYVTTQFQVKPTNKCMSIFLFLRMMPLMERSEETDVVVEQKRYSTTWVC